MGCINFPSVEGVERKKGIKEKEDRRRKKRGIEEGRKQK